MSWRTFTDPEVAHVGLYEGDANARGIETDIFKIDMSAIDRAHVDGETDGFVKVSVRTKPVNESLKRSTAVMAIAPHLERTRPARRARRSWAMPILHRRKRDWKN